MSGLPLRVAMTRDEGPDGELARALRARGLDPVSCPAVTTAPSPEQARLEDSARHVERYDWLVVASARAVVALIDARNGAPLPAALRTAAVGQRTAAVLVENGAHAPLTAARAGATALLDVLAAAGPWTGRRCLLPRALDGGRALADALRRLGADVDEVAAYRTVERPAAEIATAWRLARPEAAVVASPSVANALVHAVGVPELQRLVVLVAIGETTLAALAALGLTAVMSPRADFESVAETLSCFAEEKGLRK